MNALGRHILAELRGCNPDILNDLPLVERAMGDAARRAGATVLETAFHHFAPFGISGVVVIEESHLAIHTWPEYRYAAVDLFTCGVSVDPWLSFEHLKTAFQATNQSALELHRGGAALMNRIDFQPEEAGIPRTVGPSPAAIRAHQSAWFTDRDEAHYHEMMVHPAMQAFPEAKRALVIGGGDGGTARELLRYPNLEHVTMVQIDELVVGEGVERVQSAPAGSFDVVLVDGSGPFGQAEASFDEAFFEHCHRALGSRGILVVMQGASPTLHEKAFVARNACLGRVFPGAVRCLLLHGPSYPSGTWIVLTATKGGMDLARFDAEAAEAFADAHALRYYTPEVHRAAFALPRFVRNMLGRAIG